MQNTREVIFRGLMSKSRFPFSFFGLQQPCPIFILLYSNKSYFLAVCLIVVFIYKIYNL